MICAVIKGPTFAAALQQIKQAENIVDIVEIRFDYFTETLDLDSVLNLRQSTRLPMIFTLRDRSQGGHYAGSEEDRKKEIYSLARASPEYFDIESHVSLVFFQNLTYMFPQIKFIISFHDFTGVPPLEDIYKTLQLFPATFYKIAVHTRNSIEVLQFLSWLEKKNRQGCIIGVCMGFYGTLSRILGPVFRVPFHYVCIDHSQETASGQLTASHLKSIYPSPLDPNTKIFGLIGDPVDKSISDSTHNFAIKRQGIPAVYVKIPIAKEEIPFVMKSVRTLPFQGLSVTMPLKEEIMKYIDKIDPVAKEIGAVNTLLIEEGVIHGFNTDGIGALNAIESFLTVKGIKIAILGAGGAAKAIAYEAVRRGATVGIYNRDFEKAKILAENLAKTLDKQIQCFPLEEFGKEDYDLLINCIPVFGIDPKSIKSKKIVMDIRSNPKESEFLKIAKERDCSVIYGYQMFVEQAVEQFRLWFREAIDLSQLKNDLYRKAEEVLNDE